MSEREERPTTRLDPRQLFDLPTALMARDELAGLVEQTLPEPVPAQHMHTVPREQLVRRDQNDLIDTDIRPSITPLVWYGMILTLAVVFIAVFRLT